MKNLASALTGQGGERVALCDVAVQAVLQDLLAEVDVVQTYRNDERLNIEAVYTFPLPVDAVLLDLEVTLGGRVLKGVVTEKRSAERAYEDAVEGGDAAVMLEQIESGMYTMNVGNLLPGETAKIRLRYAVLYRWAGDRLRFFLPTTIAPRYGESRHAPHQTPAASLTVENQFSLRLEVRGALRGSQFVCPSHVIHQERQADALVLSLSQARAVMDRDFILNVKALNATRSFLLCGEDGDDGEGVAALASFQPFFPGLQSSRPLNLAIVIDCSGSMSGSSMDQARQALDGILEGLQAQDRISVIAFGNTTKSLAEKPLACNKTNVAKARSFAKALQADMGGTDIGRALDTAYRVAQQGEAADIFLVTDGEVAHWEPVVQRARESGHRIFTVGVGNAVSEAFVRELASITGGECELVSPQEGMAERVIRHFERMRAPRAQRVTIHWPDGAQDIHPGRIGAVFEGDTVVASARFARAPLGGRAVLEVETVEGEVARQELVFPVATGLQSTGGMSNLARVAAAARLKSLDPETGLEVALRYRLVSPWTNWLVVAPRDETEKATDLPALRKVPQTLAADWGGTGKVMVSASPQPLPGPMVRESMSASFRSLQAFVDYDETEEEESEVDALQGLPATYRDLVSLVCKDTDVLRINNVQGLIHRAGLDGEFRGMARRAQELALNPAWVGAVLVHRLLSGPLDGFLTQEARSAVSELGLEVSRQLQALREFVGRAAEALMSGQSSGLGAVVQSDFAKMPLTYIEGVAKLLEALLAESAGRSRHLEEELRAKRPASLVMRPI